MRALELNKEGHERMRSRKDGEDRERIHSLTGQEDLKRLSIVHQMESATGRERSLIV